MTPTHRSISIEVKALQLTKDNASEITEWCGGRLVEEIDAIHSEDRYVGVNVPTREGIKRASEGEWVIQNPLGDFTTMSSLTFAATYTKVEE